MLKNKEIKGGRFCQRCGSCCMGVEPLYGFSNLLDKSRNSLEGDEYNDLLSRLVCLEEAVAKHPKLNKLLGCIFLTETKTGYTCLIYPDRPQKCKTFSCKHLNKHLRNK